MLVFPQSRDSSPDAFTHDRSTTRNALPCRCIGCAIGDRLTNSQISVVPKATVSHSAAVRPSHCMPLIQ